MTGPIGPTGPTGEPVLPAPVTGTTLQTFVDTTGETWVARGDIAAGAWMRARDVLALGVFRGAAVTFPTTQATLIFDSTTLDVYGLYDVGTGMFTAPVAGLYHVDAQVVGGSSDTPYAGTIFAILNKTSANQQVGYAVGGGGSVRVTLAISDVIELNAGDTLNIDITATPAANIATGSPQTHFAAYYIGTG